MIKHVWLVTFKLKKSTITFEFITRQIMSEPGRSYFIVYSSCIDSTQSSELCRVYAANCFFFYLLSLWLYDQDFALEQEQKLLNPLAQVEQLSYEKIRKLFT